ncbi:MAG TPA: 3-deoxy-7-phosphoheptulonate synthase [Gammaproteobacteria bacterium]|nr:3-deoxy-7-phosphoheptulonate synthase [Gammaproteobacteria bacterium]
MFKEPDNITINPLISPFQLMQQLPASNLLKKKVLSARDSARKIINGQDQRLLVIAGPCSIHDVHASYEFAELLHQAAERFNDDLFIIMRVYFEKPRTTLGWRGLIHDPYLNGSFDINEGLKVARKFLIDLTKLGLFGATEFLDSIVPHYLSDLISWNAVGARTVESQLHREIASGLSAPVGFKNTTDGNIQIAVDAANTARHPHHFLSINAKGKPVIVKTTGNDCCHIILRGANESSNHSILHITQALQMLKKANLTPHVMIDCSHGNSMKDHRNQISVAHSIAEQIAAGSKKIFGVMLESNLLAGNQRLEKNKTLQYGQSITDACISWSETLDVLEMLAAANRTKFAKSAG